MNTKEERWKKKRLGRITASELGCIVSASGKIIDGVVSYIRTKRFERAHGYAFPVSSKAMEMGKQTEPMIYEWVRSRAGIPIVYSQDLPEIPIWIAPDCPMSASPDAYSEDESIVYEFKTLVGNENTEFFCDPFTSHDEKEARVIKEHLEQILGLFLSNPKVQFVVVVKYAPQRDEIPDDTDSPLADWRGHIYVFDRVEYADAIEKMRQRIILIDAMIGAEINPSDFKKGEWSVNEEGKLWKKP